MNSTADVWATVLSLMEQDLTPTSIQTWFDETSCIELSESKITLYTPSDFKRSLIQNKYVGNVRKALKELFGTDMEVDVLGANELAAYHKNHSNKNVLMGSQDYTFERFVVGASNRFAYNAARAVSDDPAHKYNPLFIYGQSGLGKTHLLYAISQVINQQHPDFRVVYVKGDEFTIEMVQAIREGKNDEFRQKYRACDLLLVDDIQFIAGKEATQEEFFHTFNNLYEAKKQIVLTSDRPPNEMNRLEDRLRTRFEQGLMADIQPPDYETRLAIVKNKAMSLGLDLREPVLEYIATNVTANVRQLEGSIKKILAYKELENADVDIDTVIRAVRELIRDTNVVPTPEQILKATAAYFDLDEGVVTGRSRVKEVARARNVAMYMMRRVIPNTSLEDIGKFYNRDHTTVMNSLKNVEEQMKSDPTMQQTIREIQANLSYNTY